MQNGDILRIPPPPVIVALSILYLTLLGACQPLLRDSETSSGLTRVALTVTASASPAPTDTRTTTAAFQRASPTPRVTPSRIITPTREVDNATQSSDSSQDPTGAVPGISGDGRWIVFTSKASNLVPGDTNRCASHWSWSRQEENCWDVFVRDQMTGKTIRVSVSSDGVQANGESYAPVISEDGRWVAFRSRASNLAAEWEEQCKKKDYPDNCTGVFVHDLHTGKTEPIVTMSDAGGEGGSEYLSISAKGRYITFWSAESALQPNQQKGAGNFFVYDRVRKEIEIVENGRAANSERELCLSPNLPTQRPWTAYACAKGGVFVLDSRSGERELVSTSDANVSLDARYAVLASNADAFMPTNAPLCSHPQFGQQHCSQVFVYDARSKETALVSRADNGMPGNGDSMTPTISGDGRWVVFASGANNLVANDTNACEPNAVRFRCADIFLYDRQSKTSARINLSNAGEQANDTSFSPRVSANGQFVVFLSRATNLVPGDTNKVVDVFVYNRLTNKIERVSVPTQ